MLLLDIVSHITDNSIFGKRNRGVPPQNKIAPVWKKICENTLTSNERTKMISFYNSLNDDTELRDEYLIVMNKGSNNETTNAKVQRQID